MVNNETVITTDKPRLPKVNDKDNTTGKVDLAKALQFRFKNKMTYQEIADYFGVSKVAVFKRIRAFLPLVINPEEYEDIKPALLSAMELKLLENLANPTKLKVASLNNVAYAFDKVFQANRLMRGQSTENVSIKGALELIDQAIKEKEYNARTQDVAESVNSESIKKEEEPGS